MILLSITQFLKNFSFSLLLRTQNFKTYFQGRTSIFNHSFCSSILKWEKSLSGQLEKYKLIFTQESREYGWLALSKTRPDFVEVDPSWIEDSRRLTQVWILSHFHIWLCFECKTRFLACLVLFTSWIFWINFLGACRSLFQALQVQVLEVKLVLISVLILRDLGLFNCNF